jgi:class 3 adenylate cyclase
VAAAVLRPVDPVLSRPLPTDRIAEPVYADPDPYKRRLPPGIGPVPAFGTEDGVTVLQRALFEDLPRPPLLSILGLEVVALDRGKVRLEASATEWLCGWGRQVTTGVLMDVGGAAALLALMAASPGGAHVGVSSANVAVLGTVEADGRPLVIEGWVGDREGDVLVVESRISDASGRRIVILYLTGLMQARRGTMIKVRPLLQTILFTDLVASTEKAEELGDERWSELLDQHHTLIRHHLELSRGREVKTTGDGFLTTFDNPADALESARRMRQAVRSLGLDIRVGIHTGQCEVSDGDVSGIAVHLASRVLSVAGPGEILVSSTLRDLLLGSDLQFEDRGRHKLKGIEGEWQLFALEE